MPLETMHDLLHEQLRDTLSAEKQLIKALPKLVKAANSPTLAHALKNHLRETEKQVKRLEKVFGLIGETPRAKHCEGMEGLIQEGADAASEEGEETLIDAAIIAAAQRVEHYEIAAYGCMIRYAEFLKLPKVVTLLQQTLDEEKAADLKLTEVSDSEVMADTAVIDEEESESGFEEDSETADEEATPAASR